MEMHPLLVGAFSFLTARHSRAANEYALKKQQKPPNPYGKAVLSLWQGLTKKMRVKSEKRREKK